MTLLDLVQSSDQVCVGGEMTLLDWDSHLTRSV